MIILRSAVHRKMTPRGRWLDASRSHKLGLRKQRRWLYIANGGWVKRFLIRFLWSGSSDVVQNLFVIIVFRYESLANICTRKNRQTVAGLETSIMFWWLFWWLKTRSQSSKCGPVFIGRIKLNFGRKADWLVELSALQSRGIRCCELSWGISGEWDLALNQKQASSLWSYKFLTSAYKCVCARGCVRECVCVRACVSARLYIA